MFYGRSHLHKHLHSFEKHRPDPVGLVPVGERSFLEYSERPNIPGTITDVYGGANLGNVKNGCFTNSSVFNAGTSSTSSGAALKGMTLSFSAKAGNSIFGAASTVQPAGIYGLLLLKAY